MTNEYSFTVNQPGFFLTKRDLFAAMAMQGLLASHVNLSESPITVADIAVSCADELIAALSKAEAATATATAIQGLHHEDGGS